MKTERRHQLQTNQLADWLGKQAGEVVPHSKTIVAGAIVIAAVFVTVMVVLSDRRSAQASAWTEFNVAYGSRDPVALADVAKRHAGTPVALWAQQAQADLELNRGIGALYTNRDDAMLALADARKAYSGLVDSASAYPVIQQHALFGLAQAQEATANLDEARKSYQRLIDTHPTSSYAQDATARLEALKKPGATEWYNWFSRQKPRPSSPLSAAGAPGMPGLPSDLTSLPDSPNLPPLPDSLPLTPPAGSAPESNPAASGNATPGTAPAPPAAPPAASGAPEKKAESPAKAPESAEKKVEATPPPAAPEKKSP